MALKYILPLQFIENTSNVHKTESRSRSKKLILV
jgi:hypothetical protein